MKILDPTNCNRWKIFSLIGQLTYLTFQIFGCREQSVKKKIGSAVEVLWKCYGAGKIYNTKHYSLAVINAIGYMVNSERAVRFRKWATTVIREYTLKAYVDDERIKNGGSVLTEQYFEEQLQRIREIRLTARRYIPVLSFLVEG